MELLMWPKFWSTNTREPWKVLVIELTVKIKCKERQPCVPLMINTWSLLQKVGFETYCHNETILKIMWEKP